MHTQKRGANTLMQLPVSIITVPQFFKTTAGISLWLEIQVGVAAQTEQGKLGPG